VLSCGTGKSHIAQHWTLCSQQGYDVLFTTQTKLLVTARGACDQCL